MFDQFVGGRTNVIGSHDDEVIDPFRFRMPRQGQSLSRRNRSDVVINRNPAIVRPHREFHRLFSFALVQRVELSAAAEKEQSIDAARNQKFENPSPGVIIDRFVFVERGHNSGHNPLGWFLRHTPILERVGNPSQRGRVREWDYGPRKNGQMALGRPILQDTRACRTSL